MNDVIYQASDLAGTKRVDFLRDAKEGGARLRDKDGSSLLFLPESSVEALRTIAYWSKEHLILSRKLEGNLKMIPSELGDLAWLRAFSPEEVKEFCNELHEVLIAALSDGNAVALEDAVNAWRVTAKQLEDPLRRSILMGTHDPTEYVEVAGLPPVADVE